MEGLPRISIPNVTPIQTPSLPLPTADVPSYQPLVVPPQDLRRPEGTKEVQTTENPPPKIHFPPLPSITLPSQEKIQKFLQGKINKWKQNRQKRKASSEKSKRM